MKRNKFIKNIGRFYLIAGLAATALLSSCLKDTSPGAIDFSKSPALLGFQYTGFAFTPYTAAIYGLPTDTTDIEVTLSVASITLKNAVTATLMADPAYVTTYNSANGTTYQQLPAADYTLPNNGNITIPAGTQYLKVKISFAGQNIDFTQQWALALKLTNANGAELTSNLNEAFVIITLKSIYAGTYNASGARIHPTLGTFTFNYNVAMSTVTANTIDGAAEADLQTDLQLTVNPDNSVTVGSSAYTAYPQIGLPNQYDPATKTFTLNYYYDVSAPRKISEKLVYVGP